MDKVLEMVFKTENGGKKTITVSDPKPELTRSEVEQAMQKIIAADVLETPKGGKLVAAADYQYRTTEIDEVEA